MPQNGIVSLNRVTYPLIYDRVSYVSVLKGVAMRPDRVGNPNQDMLGLRGKTPMSALGLPHALPRSGRSGADMSQEEVRARRRRLALLFIVLLIGSIGLIWSSLQSSQDSSSSGSTRSRPDKVPASVQYEQETLRKAIDPMEELRTNGFHDEKKIMLLLTNFRDPWVCAESLAQARTRAYRSSRVHFHIAEEVFMGSEDSCVKAFCELQPEACGEMIRNKTLRFVRRDASGALGETVARYLAEGLVNGVQYQDDFYLSVEAGVTFTGDWDLQLLKQWYNTGNSMAILSVAPKALELQEISDDVMLLHCSARIHSMTGDAVVEFNAPEPKPRSGEDQRLNFPVLQTQYSEIFHFGPVSALMAVRSDPYTPFITVGHEYARAARFWTHGYDFYAPVQDTLFYDYDWRAHATAGTNATTHESAVQISNRRIRRLLGLPVSTSATEKPLSEQAHFRLGSRRTLEMWHKFSRIEPQAAYNESTRNQFVTCDQHVQYVPYAM